MNEVCVEEKVETSVEALCLSKVYWDGGRRLEVFRDLTLLVPRGKGLAIFGPSGSGKTTLLNLLTGLDRPTEGRVIVGGVELGRLNEAQRAEFRNRSIGFVFQFYHLLSEFTALENVMLPAMLRKSSEDEARIRGRAAALLERVGLKKRARHFPSELSGGEQQRVAIARALMNDPEILFCDEPTGNLDLSMAREIAALLNDLYRKEKKTVLIVTHDENMAKQADRVWNIVSRQWQ
jgi:lipoprotein-releasing system ATP-binding protein